MNPVYNPLWLIIILSVKQSFDNEELFISALGGSVSIENSGGKAIDVSSTTYFSLVE